MGKSKVAFLLCFLTATSAWAAKQRIVVLAFDGQKADEAHDAVEAIVAGQDTLVSASAYARAEGKLGFKRALDKDEDLARVATELQVDAVIAGEVKKGPGGKTLLKLTVREGKTGHELQTVALAIHSPVADEDVQAITDKLVPALAGAAPLVEVQHEEPPPPPPPPPPHEEPPHRVEQPPVEPAGRAYVPAADVTVGVSAVSRSMSFVYDPGLPAAQRPNGYRGGLVPSAFLVGELYPLAFQNRNSAAAGIGLAFDIDRVFFLKSKLRATEYPTNQTRWGVGLRYRFTIGHEDTSPIVKIGAGFDHLDFTIDRGSDSIDFPNVSYTYLDLRAGARVPIATPKFGLFADAAYLVVFSAGEIQDKTSYGGGRVNGAELEAGFDIRPTPRAVIKLAFRYQRMAYAFDGSGTESTSRDNDPGDQDVGGALDEYVGGYLSFGYLF